MHFPGNGVNGWGFSSTLLHTATALDSGMDQAAPLFPALFVSCIIRRWVS
jgi:hypothetical protein